MILALDSCTVVYLVEGGSELGRLTRDRVTHLLADAHARAVCSRLARLECRVGPLRRRDHLLVARYDEFFSRARVSLLDIDAAVIERATALRAHHGFGVADAIHLASAIDTGADIFLTGDRRLALCPDLHVEVIGEPARETPP